MTNKQYIRLLKELDLTPYKAGPVLGISPRMSMRYSAGTHPIPATIAKLVRALVLLGRHDV